jgi:aminoglycoside phosphotransferase (APT) family kinase protein
VTTRGIEAATLAPWLEANVAGARGPFAYELIAGGHSNLTFRVRCADGRALVLRRPPLGHVLESAHDMGREHRILAALGPTDVPVAPVLGLCRDPAVNGAPFYLMAFVEGVVLHDSVAAAKLSESERRAVGLHTIDVLARLHGLDPDAVGLGDLGRKEGYLARQLSRWTRQWQASKQREIPEMEAVQAQLAARMPEQVGTAIVHGDFRLGNFLVRGGRIAAVLDWELCTLGDPLADVGYLMNYWPEPGEVPLGAGDMSPTAAGGFPPRAEMLRLYAARTGRDVSGIAYYRAFSYWRSAAIAEGVYARYVHGAMGRAPADAVRRFEESVPRLARQALELLSSL